MCPCGAEQADNAGVTSQVHPSMTRMTGIAKQTADRFSSKMHLWLELGLSLLWRGQAAGRGQRDMHLRAEQPDNAGGTSRWG